MSDNSPTISASITGANGITFNNANGATTLTLSQVPGWTGTTTVNSGTVKFGSGGFTMPGTIEGLGNLQFANTSGTITLAQTAGTHNIGSIILNAATANVTFAGIGSTNFIGSGANFWNTSTARSTATFQSGNWYIPGAGNGGDGLTNLNVTGGFLQVEGGRFFRNGSDTTNISGGTLQVTGGYNLSSNGGTTVAWSISGTGLLDIAMQGTQNQATFGSSGTGSTYTVNQTGGTLQTFLSYTSITNSNTNGPLTIGSNTAGTTATYNLKGGTFRDAGALQAAGSSSSNNFNFTGGTLTIGTYTAANMTSNDGVNSGTGTLYQSGKDAISNLAPGDLWTSAVQSYGTTAQYTGLFSGKTTITGNYQADASSNAANIVINLSGPTQAGSFHDAGIGKYDFVNVNTGAITLNSSANGSVLDLNALPGFIGRSSDTFTVMSSTGTGSGLSGAFNNVASGSTLTVGDAVFAVTYNNTTKTVALTLPNTTSLNQWNAASASNWSTAGSWSGIGSGGIVPGSSNTYTARFADGTSAPTGAVTVNLDANETVNGLAFDSTTRGYTISSSSSKGLTLDATGFTASGTGYTGQGNTAGVGIPAAINVVNGSYTGGDIVSVPITLNSDLYVNVQNSADLLTLGGALNQGTGSAHNMSVYGAGTLVLSSADSLTGALNLNTSTAGKGVELNTGFSMANASAINFDGNNNTLLVNTNGNLTLSQPITVNASLLNGVYSNGNSPTGTAYIGYQTVATALGASNTATFSGGINLIGYSILNVQPNDSSSGASYVFSGDVSNSIYALDNSGVLNGASGAGIITAQTNGVVVKFTGNIGYAGSTIGTGANGASTGSASALNFVQNTKGGTTWVGNSGKTVNLYNLYFNPTATTNTISGTTASNELVLGGDITAYALYSWGVASNSLNQIVGNATAPAYNTLNVVGSENMAFTGVIGGTGANQNNLALNLKPGGPFTVTLNGIDSFTGGLIVGNGAVNITTVGSSSTAATWTASNTSSVLTVGSTAGLVVGQSVSGTGISSGAQISDILSATTVGITGSTTGSGASVTFGAGSGVGGTANTVTLGNSATNESGKLIVNGAGQTTTVAGIYTAGSGTANEIVGGASSVSTLSVAPSGTDTYGGILGGGYTNENNLALIMNGAGGTLVLGGVNTFTGAVTINAGTLSIATLAASGAAQPLGETRP